MTTYLRNDKIILDNIRIKETDDPEEGRSYDMKCRYCKAELEEGELFCSNCGQKVDIVQEVTISEEAGVFCPKCGKKFTNGEIFCDNCGTNLTDDHISGSEDITIDRGKKNRNRHGNKWHVGVIVVVFIVGILGIGIFKIAPGVLSGVISKDKVLYVKDQNLYMTDIHNLKKQEKVCFVQGIESWYDWGQNPWLKEELYQGDGDLISQRFLTKDQKDIYFIKNYDLAEDKFELYKAETTKLGDGELIDREVSFFEILENEVLYIKNSIIYYGNEEERKKFGKGVYDFKIDTEGGSILWTEERKTGEDITYNLYWQDLKQKNEKVKLYSGLSSGRIGTIGDIYPNKDLSIIILENKGTIYRITNRGEKEELCLGDRIYGVNADEGTFYYRIDGKRKKEWKLKDFIYDDTNDMTDDDWEELEKRLSYFLDDGLYFYNKGDNRRVSSAMEYRTRSFYNGDNHNYLLFSELNDDTRVRWSEYKKLNDEDRYEYWWTDWVSDVKLAIDGNVILDLGCGYDDENFSFLSTQSDKLNLYSYKDVDYFSSLDEDDMVYTIYTDGERKGKIEECDLEFDNATILFSDEKGLYYINDRNNGYGDLYCQDEILVYGVYEARYLALDKILCCTDHDEENGCTYDIYDGEKTKRIGEGIKAIQYMEDGTVLMLANYDSGSRTGDLVYYDGKKNVTIEDEVSSFVKKDGKSILFHGWKRED